MWGGLGWGGSDMAAAAASGPRCPLFASRLSKPPADGGRALKCSHLARRWACRTDLPPPPCSWALRMSCAAGPGAGWTPGGLRSAPGRLVSNPVGGGEKRPALRTLPACLPGHGGPTLFLIWGLHLGDEGPMVRVAHTSISFLPCLPHPMFNTSS